jgi:Tol biopolymer transport system component
MLEKNRGISPREVSIARLWRDPSGFRVTFLTDDKHLNRRPAISPDGKLLAWQTNRAGGRDEIFLANIDGSQPRNLTNTPSGHEGHPWFSRDGKWVIFESDRGGDYEFNACDRRVACEIYKQHIDTGEVVQLTRGGKKFVSHRPRM